jgi:hypothetical protein
VNYHRKHITTTAVTLALALTATVAPVAGADPWPLQLIENQYASHHKQHHNHRHHHHQTHGHSRQSG